MSGELELREERVAGGPAEGPRIERGSVTAYRIFDIADEIRLSVAERLLAGGARRRLRAPAAEAAIHIPEPPLAFDLGARVVSGRSLEASVQLYDFGAVSIRLRHRLEDARWSSLHALSARMQTDTAIDAASREVLAELVPRIAPALDNPHHADVDEDYTIVQLDKLEGNPSAKTLTRRGDLPHVILGEEASRRLSRTERRDVLDHSFSYYADDVAFVDWNSALVYDPSGSTDIPEVLELATAQLLELRYYDALLDRELKSVYDMLGLEARRGTLSRLFASKYARLLRRVAKTMLEVGEFTERAENALKVVGDFFLARVYTDAVQQFRIPQWQLSVYRKLESLGQVYGLLKGEVDTKRSQLLELTIVLLIVGEILLAALFLR